MVILFSLVCALLALGVAGFFATRLITLPLSNPRVAEITAAIKVAAGAYLARQYRTVGIVAIVIAGILLVALQSFPIAFGFLVGAAASALAGYIGMTVAVSTNGPLAERASKGLSPAFRLAFQSGAVTGMLVVGLALLVLTLFYWWTKDAEAL